MVLRKGTKRQAAVAADGVLKKLKGLAAIKCPEEAMDLTKDALSAVQWKMIQRCLKVCGADDHGFQEQAVEMAGTMLCEVKSRLERNIDDASAKVKASEHKTASIEAQMVATKKCQEFKARMKSLNDCIEVDLEAQKAAKARLGEAEAACRAKEAGVACIMDKKAKLENIMKDAYEPLKNGEVAGRDEAKTLNALGKVLSDFDIESSLVNSLKDTLKKDVESRGTFVLEEVETQVRKRVEGIDVLIKEAGRSEGQVTNAKAGAEAAYNASSEKLFASKRTFFKEFMAAEESVFLAEEASAKQDEGVKAAEARLDAAREVLAAFVEGPWQSFADLKSTLKETS
jgi:hypothetical protein